MKRNYVLGMAVAMVLTANSAAQAQMRITEWQYNGSEFVEFTNIGGASIDMTGWSFDDDSRTAGSLSLSAFGLVNAGESVLLSEVADTAFRTTWGLSASVKVIGGSTQNLGRNDELNLYDSSNTLIDRLTFGDQNIPGTIRTDTKSGNPNSFADLGLNNVANWKFSAIGDEFNSINSNPVAYIANPGFYPIPTSVPEPASFLLLAIGAVASAFRRKR